MHLRKASTSQYFMRMRRARLRSQCPITTNRIVRCNLKVRLTGTAVAPAPRDRVTSKQRLPKIRVLEASAIVSIMENVQRTTDIDLEEFAHREKVDQSSSVTRRAEYG
jgi:hypothetical protein